MTPAESLAHAAEFEAAQEATPPGPWLVDRNVALGAYGVYRNDFRDRVFGFQTGFSFRPDSRDERDAIAALAVLARSTPLPQIVRDLTAEIDRLKAQVPPASEPAA